MYGRFVVAAIETGLGIVDALARQQHTLLDQHRGTVAFFENLGTKRGNRTKADLVFIIHQPYFQGRRAAQNILGTRRVLYAGQLHHDSIHALLLDHRFGHTQFIHPVAQGDQVLLHGGFLNACLFLRFERRHQQIFIGDFARDKSQTGKTLLEFRFSFGARFHIAELGGDLAALAAHTGVSDIGLTQGAANIAGRRFQRFVQRRFHVHLHQEVDTAA